ncbi:hypothetical protein BJ875DRAFT_8796 [Amylocarpus encephaloides]|uniref:NADH-ubiquinone oxidoreductase chain 2 n=1 Tax=Amylocarpus encephaloides TaxID=45428 RepID=A0A9P7YJZ9_9HELO|nr:hypothetical protein BJ875DRAFT_8796 [Amylocarpus encephaloides]
MQYSLSNLNAFIILISIGFSLFSFINKTREYLELSETNNSPIQLISQLKGYFYINPVLALSLSITIFSFVGIPPLIGFFAKQMVLSAALDSGYVFMALIAILTSVISAVYYLNIIKQVFFYKPDYDLNSELITLSLQGNIAQPKVSFGLALAAPAAQTNQFSFKVDSILLSSHLSISISILSLIILLFIFIPQE